MVFMVDRLGHSVRTTIFTNCSLRQSRLDCTKSNQSIESRNGRQLQRNGITAIGANDEDWVEEPQRATLNNERPENLSFGKSYSSVIVDLEMKFLAFRVILLNFLALPVTDFQDVGIDLCVSNPFPVLVFPIRVLLTVHRLRHSLVRLPCKFILSLFIVSPLHSLIQEVHNHKRILFRRIAEHSLEEADEFDFAHDFAPLSDINRLRIKAI
jgi:hypothetical protein